MTAIITAPRIDEVKEVHAHFLTSERDVNSTGALRIHSAVSEAYLKNKFDELPQSRQERDERELSGGWNGLETSAYHIDNEDGVHTVFVTPMRYFFREAYAGIDQPNLELKSEMCPWLLHTSMLIPATNGGSYGLLSQIKAKDTLGGGAILVAAAAGGVKPGNFAVSQHPLREGLRMECSEEIGLDSESIEKTPFLYRVNDPNAGTINFSAVKRGVSQLDDLLHAYQSYAKSLPDGKNPEVAGFAFMPFADRGFDFGNLLCYSFSSGGEMEAYRGQVGTGDNVEMKIRPWTGIFHDYFQQEGKIRQFMDAVES